MSLMSTFLDYYIITYRARKRKSAGTAALGKEIRRNAKKMLTNHAEVYIIIMLCLRCRYSSAGRAADL